MSERGIIETTRRGIHFSVSGDGRPIVLGHSFMCSGDMWASQVDSLSARYQVINIDARGHGDSKPVDADFSLYDMIDDVLEVMDKVGTKSAVWAGLSIGGMVALRAALTHPERVEAMMLLDTDAGAERRLKRMKYAIMGWIAKTMGMRWLQRPIGRQMFGVSTLRNNHDLVKAWCKRFNQVHIPSILRMLKALQTRDDVTGRLGEITVPALILVGEQDRSLPPIRSQNLARGLPNATFVEIADAGHLSTLEQPKAVTATMHEFMAKLQKVRVGLNPSSS